MIRKYFFTSALLSLALVLVVSEVAQAQSRLRERRSERRSMRRGTVVSTESATPATTQTMRSTTSYYYTPEVIQGDRTGHIQLRLPTVQTRVTFDDLPTTQTGTERTYHTPALKMGATNMYRIRATWTQDGSEITQEQIVPVLPGRTLVVTFPQR